MAWNYAKRKGTHAMNRSEYTRLKSDGKRFKNQMEKIVILKTYQCETIFQVVPEECRLFGYVKLIDFNKIIVIVFARNANYIF